MRDIGMARGDIPVAMRMRVVPVSTMPAVEDRMFVDVPYLMDWSMPKKSEAGDVRVRGLQSGGRHLNGDARVGH